MKEALEGCLREAEADGWELCGMDGGDLHQPRCVLVFKRPVVTLR
jgi:hypothetical protein